jgi:hypothetical protein
MARPILAPVGLPIKDADLRPAPPPAVLRILDRQVDQRTWSPFHQWQTPLSAGLVSAGPSR